LRSEGSRDRVAEGLQHTDDEAFAQAPEQALEVDHDLQRIEAALRALPERSRQIFLLNRIHGCTYGEIAKAMQLSQSAVEKHMMRALEACKASVAEATSTAPARERPSMSLEPPITAEQSQAALGWLMRIQQQPEQAESAAFKRWLLQAPAHRQAYAEAQALWRQTEAPAARLAAEEQAGLQQYLEAMRRPARKPHWQRFAVAACLVLALGGVAGWQPQHWLQDLRADYTSAEQVRQVTLADGSQLTLDAGTAIGVDFDQGERRVRLLRGAAFFQVTHTGAPFLVDANGGQVRVLGTQFEVREQGEGPRSRCAAAGWR
jgi:hypothetical protein